MSQAGKGSRHATAGLDVIESVVVPRLSAFYGIVIAMYWRDHHPGHFHAIYAGREAQVEIATLEVLAGSLPPNALRLVREWAIEHRPELEENWRRARAREPLASIEPLR